MLLIGVWISPAKLHGARMLLHACLPEAANLTFEYSLLTELVDSSQSTWKATLLKGTFGVEILMH